MTAAAIPRFSDRTPSPLIDLTAEGTDPRQRCKFRLASGAAAEIGRDSQADLPIPWDPFISRRHVRIAPTETGLRVEKLAAAGNPLFFDGNAVESCDVPAGRHFVLGSTTFTVERVAEADSGEVPAPVEEMTFEPQDLRNVKYRDADRRIEVLSRLPEVIWGARTDSELNHRVVHLVLAGVPQAEAAAIVDLDEDEHVRLVHWDRRHEAAGGFRPSSRLVADALSRKRKSVLHVWRGGRRERQLYTEAADFDWAWCTPVIQPSAPPRGIYVAGRLSTIEPGSGASGGVLSLQADVKFTELLAEIISNVQRLSRLEQQRSGLRQFFAPQVFSALGEDLDTDVLRPRECDVTVMFCDLRGFSQKAEESAGNLIGLLERVSAALEVMTNQILRYGGVTGDFLGDAALGFWGWPFPSDDAPVNACRAALGIRQAFERIHEHRDHPLANFHMGIGVAHGRAVAGKIGTSEQVKVTVFGPVVNLASRLEGMTRVLRVPIVLDDATASIVRPRLDPREGRLRKLGRVLPYGMEKPVLVSELLPPESEHPELTDAHIRQYEAGVECLIAGRWEEAYRHLHGMPAGDRAQDFLSVLIGQHNRVAPPEWDGTIRLPSK